MKRSILSSAFAVLALAAAPGARAQTPVDPSGHWQGAVDTPRGRLEFELDVVKAADGRLAGTISLPAEHINGLPLAKVELDGRSLTFAARLHQVLTGVLSPDGGSMTGTFAVKDGSAPFTAARSGDARIEPRPTLAPVPKMLEGTWNGTIDVQQGALHLVLTLTNQADGTSSGTIVNLDEGGIAIPVSAMSVSGSDLTLEMKAIDGRYVATIAGDGLALSGTLTQGALALPLTFRRRD